MAFKDLVRQQRQQGSGILSSVGSAAAGSVRESLDIRNALFSSGSFLNTLFPKVKGFKAGNNVGKGKSPSLLSSLGSDLSSTKLDQIGENTKIAAKNSFVLPAMARDMNVMRQNIVKLVKLQGGTASTKADMFFMKAGEREAAYENRIGAVKQSTSPTKTEAPEKKGGILGMIGGMLGAMGFFNTLLKGLLVAIGAGVALYFASDKFSNFIDEQFKSFSGVISKILEPFSGPDSTFILMLSNVVSQLGKFGGAISPILRKLGLLGTALTIIQGKAEANEAERVREKNIKSQSDPNAPKLTPEEQKTLDDWNKKTDFSRQQTDLDNLIASGDDMSPPPPRPGSERDSSGRYEYEYMLDPDLKRPAATSGGTSGSTSPTPTTTTKPASTAPTAAPTSSASNLDGDLVSFIKSKEGLRLKAYEDHGQYSIGYGTKASGPDEVITEAEAERRLLAEIKKRKDYVVNFGKKHNYDWNEKQINALTSFAYNVGSLDQLTANGKRSNEEIARMMPQYNKASGKTIPALAQRRNEEVAMFGGNSAVPTMLASATPAAPTSTNTVGASLNAGSVQAADGRMSMGSGQSVVVNAPQTNVQAPQGGQRSSGNIPSVVDTDFMRHLVAQLVT
jgi:GH24 family phage-related lysozyme (muramidase)